MRTERYSAVEDDDEPEFIAPAAAGAGVEEVVGRPESGDDSVEQLVH